MSWDKELEELRHREGLAEQMGGGEKVARQHSRGKMDARARLAALVDPGSFREIGKIAKQEQSGIDFLVLIPPFAGERLCEDAGRDDLRLAALRLDGATVERDLPAAFRFLH